MKPLFQVSVTSYALFVQCCLLGTSTSVLQDDDSTRAVFDLGDDWDCARELILTFIKSRSPESFAEKRQRLCPQWDPSPEPLDGCACGETCCDCRRDPVKDKSRARHVCLICSFCCN